MSKLKLAVICPAQKEEIEETISESKLELIEEYFEIVYISNGKDEKIIDFQKAIDKHPDVIMAWRGGRIDGKDESQSSIELVKELTEDLIKSIPDNTKFIGYSDITYLLTYLSNKGFCCYYGPNFHSSLLSESDEKKTKFSLEQAKKLFEGDSEIYLSNNEFEKPIIINGGSAEGILVGGNLDTIFTEYLLYPECVSNYTKKILFFEEHDSVYWFVNNDDEGNIKSNEINNVRKLEFLYAKGFFNNVEAIIVGKSETVAVIDSTEKYDDENLSETDVLKIIFSNLKIDNIPIISNVLCSHCHPMYSLPVGKNVYLDADNCTLKIL